MKLRSIVYGATLVIATATITSTVLSQQDKGKGQDKDKAKAPPGMTPEQQKMMQDFAAPGPNHKVLDFKVGKWTTALKMWMDPSQPAPMETTGSGEFKWILDGRYLSDDETGDFMGQPFHGHGISGYDNLKKKFIGFWIDNMGTGFMVAEGTYDAASKTFKFNSEMPDPEQGKYVKMRSEEKIVDNDHWTITMYAPQDGNAGKEMKMMEINYTRAK
jgi:Protein of unknown function (DUF1579)